MATYIPREIREKVRKSAYGLCGYCRTHEDLLGIKHEFDHLTPISRGGETVIENLWLACRRCNAFKGEKVRGKDAVSGEETALFNPRQDDWHDHFSWQDGGLRIAGKTAKGRVTVVALNLNLPILLRARSLWILSGRFPPSADSGFVKDLD